MDWQDRDSVKKGNIGERIVRDHLESKGFVVYEPVTQGAHPFDKLVADGKKRIFIAEIKTKPAREVAADTGFNWQHYQEYLFIAMKHNMEVFVYFCDEARGLIYGGELITQLSREREIDHRIYPLKINTKYGKSIILFPLSSMVLIAKLTPEQCSEIGQYRNTEFITQRGFGF